MENLTQNIQKLIRQINQKITLFFTEREYPTTLSIFRIVLFGYILYFVLNKYDYSYIELFSNIPKELKFLPGTFGALIEYFLPINKTAILILHRVLIVTCFTAMVGFKSRISALLVVISGFYILGIPQLYGKVNHYHHLLWFASILAASPCSDFLSVDAIFRAWRQTTPRNIDESYIPSRAYALPLKFVYLLIGIIYFFPGFWKVRTSGLAWALSENLKFQLYNKWHSLGGWMPIFRVDEYPILYKLSALGSLVFEIGFIFIILFPRLRFLAAISGLIFHNMTRLLMRIPFVSLQICYVAFFDWHNIFCQVGKRIYKQEMHVFYRGNSDVHCKIIAALKTFDIFHQITYISTLDNHRVAQYRSNFVGLSNPNLNLAAIVGQRVWLNFEAYQVIAIRIPLLWPFLAPLYVWSLFRRNRHVEPLVVVQ
ncbi:MAG: HTTM domain-containing protein, partial [Bacteroidota bacterium]